MENIVKITVWMTLIGLVNCFTYKNLVIVNSWSGGVQGYATIHPPIHINRWILHIHFDSPVSDLQVWQGRIVKQTRTDFDIQNMANNGNILANQAFYFSFIFHGDFNKYNYPLGKYYTTVYSEQLRTSDLPNTVTMSTPTTTSSTTASHSTRTPTTASTIASTTASHSTRTPTKSASVSSTLSSILRPTQDASQAKSKFACKKFESVVAVAEHKHVTSKDSANSVKVTGGANEDLVLSMCNVTNTDQWRRGKKVMGSCSYIQLYTPVATFKEVGTDSYLPRGAQSGIFVGCLFKGFRLIVQHCNGYPVIEHIEVGGIFNQDPDKYFVIQ